MKKNNRQARTDFAKAESGAVRVEILGHRLGGYCPGIAIGSSGMPIHPATYATPTSPPVTKKPTTARMRTTATSQPLACASARHTPAIWRPTMGLTSGLPGIGVFAEHDRAAT